MLRAAHVSEGDSPSPQAIGGGLGVSPGLHLRVGGWATEPTPRNRREPRSAASGWSSGPGIWTSLTRVPWAANSLFQKRITAIWRASAGESLTLDKEQRGFYHAGSSATAFMAAAGFLQPPRYSPAR